MENAGGRVVEFLTGRFPDLARRRIVVLCGRGNNGGDGFVVARRLRVCGATATVILVDDPEAVRGDASVNLKRWREIGGELRVARLAAEWEAAKGILPRADLVVDAMLGTGLRGPAEGMYRRAIEDLNRRSANSTVVAVDIPSGLPSDAEVIPGEAVTADFTVTFTAPKFGQVTYPATEKVGVLIVRSIGSPRQLIEEVGKGTLRWLEPGEFASLRLRRKPDTNKGNYGHALIVAGSRGKSGAAVLAAWAALRVGVGLVTVAAPDVILPIVAIPVPEVMTEPMHSTDAGTISMRSLEYGHFADLRKGKSAMALGPGLSTHQETQLFIRSVMEDSALPIILDADGLNAFSGRTDTFKRRHAPTLTLTPHPGEMARLIGGTVQDVQMRRLEVAQRAAADWDAFIVLKGHQTVVAAPDGRALINSTGNPGMATGGTGDVLTGMLAGLAAQFAPEHWEVPLGLGVYLHGLAGDIAATELGEAPLMATDLIRAIPRAYAQVVSEIGSE
jgi:NAD(P)H-hydrate epimerase